MPLQAPRAVVTKRPKAKPKGKPKGRPKGFPKHMHFSLSSHDACHALMSASQKVEKKGGGYSWVTDPEVITSIRGMMNSTHTYDFRVWAAPANAVVSANVTAGAFTAAAITAVPEWAGILAVLFDEYRVEEMRAHIRPIAIGGSTSGFDKYAYAICNDYIAATTPSSWEICLERAESELRPVCASSGSGFFSYETQPQGSGVGSHCWTFKPPWEFALAGTTAGITGFVDISQSWPGAVLVYAETTATNGTVTLTCWREFHVKFRMRR